MTQSLSRRTLLGLLGAPWPGAWAAEGDWPSRPPRLVVPYSAGGAADQTARLLARALGNRLKTSVVVDNRPGGGGVIGESYVAQAAADGQTLLLDATGFVINPLIQPKLAFDPARDLQPVSLLTRTPLLLVVPADAAWTSVDALLKEARQARTPLSFASAGNGSAQQLCAELFALKAGLQLTHVPYRGGAPALNDLMAGQVSMMFSAMPACLPFVQAGRLRALAVTAAQRSPRLPQVPSLAESGFAGFSAQEWNGLWLRAGTPPRLGEQIEAAVRAAMQGPALREQLLRQGVQPVGGTRDEFRQFLAAETAQWSQVIRQAGIT
ncbi:MAG: tripartite tricarboxylate transporter substrate binding protein [Curvibacter sp.]|nr:tripartite tricarboxylate transporter substrate binding protein [Curvibacter sp.]